MNSFGTILNSPGRPHVPAFSPGRAMKPKLQRKRIWTPAEMAFVAANYKNGMTAEQIAQRLKRTRNEVIGKAYRTIVPKEKSLTRGV